MGHSFLEEPGVRRKLGPTKIARDILGHDSKPMLKWFEQLGRPVVCLRYLRLLEQLHGAHSGKWVGPLNHRNVTPEAQYLLLLRTEYSESIQPIR